MEIVKEYVNMFNNDLQKDFNEFNPLEKFSKINKTISMKKIMLLTVVMMKYLKW